MRKKCSTERQSRREWGMPGVAVSNMCQTFNITPENYVATSWFANEDMTFYFSMSLLHNQFTIVLYFVFSLLSGILCTATTVVSQSGLSTPGLKTAEPHLSFSDVMVSF